MNRRVLAIAAVVVGLLAGALAGAGAAQAAPPDGFYQIKNAVNHRCLDAAVNIQLRKVHLWECDSDESLQFWQFIDLGDGTFWIYNYSTRMCLWGVLGRHGSDVVNRVCDPSVTGLRWRWQFADQQGHTVLTNSLTTPGGGELCLAIDPYSSRNGARIALNECATTSGQLWYAFR